MGIIRLTLFSMIGIGGAMLWFGRDEGLPEDRLGYVPRTPDVVVTAPIADPEPTPAAMPTPTAVIASAPEVVAPEPAIVAPEPEPEPTAEPEAETQPPTPSLPTLFVTGTTVNMRAGTSTREAIVAKLGRGTAVSFLGEAAPGWSEIQVVETGARGFMASRFLSPDRP